MDVSNQTRLSGLLMGIDQDEPKWTRNDQGWPPLDRYGHASVVVHSRANNMEEMVVVVGGEKLGEHANNSVFLLNAAEESKCRQWIQGPHMNEARLWHAAVVCNGSVYAIGGNNDHHSLLNTIERIDIIDLLSAKKRDKENLWKTLTCRLSKARKYCSAAAIDNRYIVVLGGLGGLGAVLEALASVEIIDTMHENQPNVFNGQPLNVPRYCFGMTVIGSCIYVVGGTSKGECFNSVECLKLSDSRGDGTNNKGESIFPSSLSWAIHVDLALTESRWGHAVARVGSCLVVSGGWAGSSWSRLRSVEVMDTKRNKVWKMVPEMTVPRSYHNMVTLSTGIVCISGVGEKSCERLSLVDQNSVVFRNLLLGTNGTRLCLKEM